MREFGPEVADLEDERFAAEPFGGEPRNDRGDRCRGREGEVVIELQGEPDRTQGETQEGPAAAKERVPVGVCQGQRDDVNPVDVATMPAAVGIVREVQSAVRVRPADDRHLMSALDQRPRELIGARTARTLWGREMLMEVKEAQLV